MRKWILKAIVQKTISFLPYKNNINLLFQKYVTKGLALNDEHFGYKIQHATDHINYALQYKKTIKLDCLELGTGWYPIVPIALFLSGANQIHTIDLSSHLTRDSIKDTLDKYLEWHSKGKLTDLMALAIPEKWQQLIETHQKIEQLDRDDLLKIFKINPIVGDARQINFEDNSIDFICSNNTFEHIYKEVLEGILKEFHRVVKKKGGLMSHFIDMSDHFAHYDQSINIYNFLQFSPSAWNRIDNSIQPQNRLRFDDYRKMYNRLGILITEENYRKGNLTDLRTIDVNDCFQHLSEAEIAISHGYMISDF